ncbi:MAG: EutN/CcmL family microcompartment protein [Abditibacteriales bacterium]|nr:EutN/CcmL family microcompartment protein [Abditibacteriales bacterium]MDW8364920.1 EutN/CcmL family microcompartment protein [Abditibacteriales bacterium]
MKLAKVIGSVVSTIKNDTLRGAKLLLVQPLNLQQQPTGRAAVAVDTVDAGVGDIVLVVEEGRAARERFGATSPVRSVIVGVVDKVDVRAVENHDGTRTV